MASIERTAYPRFKKSVSQRELVEVFTPSIDEISWAAEATRQDGSQLTLLVLLKAFERLGYFPKLADVPGDVVAHIGRSVGLAEPGIAEPATRTTRRYRVLVRTRVGVVHDPVAARKLIVDTIELEARTKDNPADLINVALEELIKAHYELPGYSTLDRAASTIRARVNQAFFAEIGSRVDAASRQVLLGLLQVDNWSRHSRFDDFKRPARRPSLSRLKAHTETLRSLDQIGDTAMWLGGLAPAKAAHFAAEARVLDASDMNKITETKRLALLVCLVHRARIRGRDELAEMLCRRMATIHKRCREDLADIRNRQRRETERLWSVFGSVLAAARQATDPDGQTVYDDPDGPDAVADEGGRGVGVREFDDDTVQRAGTLMLESLVAGGGLQG